MRNRRHVQRKGPLIVYSKDQVFILFLLGLLIRWFVASLYLFFLLLLIKNYDDIIFRALGSDCPLIVNLNLKLMCLLLNVIAHTARFTDQLNLGYLNNKFHVWIMFNRFYNLILLIYLFIFWRSTVTLWNDDFDIIIQSIGLWLFCDFVFNYWFY